MKDEEEIGPADSLSNKGSGGDIQACLEDIKELEREKNKDKEKKPIPQSIIFTIFGLIAAFLSYIETSSICNLFYSYNFKNVNKSKLFLEDIKYIGLLLISLFLIRFKIKVPKIHQIVLPFLFSFLSYSSSYLYSRNQQSFILLSKVFCILFVCIYFGVNNIIQIRKDHSYKLPSRICIGLFLVIFGILIEFISSYINTINNGEDNIRFLFHYNDFINFLIALGNGICYALIIFFFDLYCKSLESVFDTLFYIGLISTIICFVLSIVYSEISKIKSTFLGVGETQTFIYILTISLFLIYIILQSILIKKCSIYSAGIIISEQISIRNIVDMIKYQNGSNSNIFTIISLILCTAGLFIICLHHISNGYNENKKTEYDKTESFKSNGDKKYALVNPISLNDDI